MHSYVAIYFYYALNTGGAKQQVPTTKISKEAGAEVEF